MPRFQDMRITVALFIVVIPLITLGCVTTFFALRSIGKVETGGRNIAAATERLQHAARATSNFLSLANAIGILSRQLSPHERSHFEAIAADEEKRLWRRIELIAFNAVNEEDRAKVRQLDQYVSAFLSDARQATELAKAGAFTDAGAHVLRASTHVEGARAALRNLEEKERTLESYLLTEASTVAANAFSTTITLFAVGIVFSLTLTSYVAFIFICRPIITITDCMTQVAAGRLDTAIPYIGSKNEIGKLAHALGYFKDALVERRRLDEQRTWEQARKEKRVAEIAAAIAEFDRSANEIVLAVSTGSTQIENAADTLAQQAAATRDKSGSVKVASESASKNMQNIAVAISQLTSSINVIFDQSHLSNKKMSIAVSEVRSTDHKFSKLMDIADRIDDVVELITSVAKQTNLLALNAAIEAARAGTAGRGFAVVASEVKALAGQTARATEAIRSQITSMQTATRDTVASIQSIGTAIAAVADIAKTISAAIEEQDVAVRDIAVNVQEAAKASTGVASSIREVSVGVDATGQASSQLLVAAQELASQGVRLKTRLAHFVEAVEDA